MSKLYSLFILLAVGFSTAEAQNIAVNTTGTPASNANLFEVTQSSTTNNTVGFFTTHTGAATNAYAIWAAATGATNKYAIVVPSGGGSVGIGTITPLAALDVTGVSAVPTIAFGQGTNTPPSTTSAWGSLVGKSSTSNFQINLQDGSRTALLWNASGTGGNYLVSAEPAVRQRFHVSTGGYIDFAGAPAGTAGSAITWTTMGAMESSNYVWFSPRGTSSDFYIPASTGYVGVGTAAPGGKLDISGGYSSGAIGVPAGLAIAANGTSPDRAQIWWGDNTGWKLNFGTRDASGNFQSRVTFVDQGNVGIGTTAPNRKLEILSGNSDGITFGQEADNTQTIQTYIDGQWSNRATYAGGCCNALAIQPDVGTVGIGTTAPTQKLDVRGNIALPNNGSQIIFPEISGNTSYNGLASNNGYFADGVPWYGGFGREPGAWAYPYPDVVISNHTGLRLDAHSNYGGISFYEQLNAASTAWSSTGNEIARFRDNRWGGSYFMSNVGIGTSSPGVKLEVVGTSGATLKIVDGNQAAGKVLVSDATGNASWQSTTSLQQVYTVQASQTNINSTSFINVIGLSQTITTTKTCYFIINTTGSLESQGASGSWTGTITALDRGGTSLTEQGNDIVNTTSPAVNQIVTHWGINYTEILPAGTYTYKVKARLYNGTAYFYAGGAVTTGLPNDGTMTIQVIPQ